jgi:UDP-glucose 4-epimerase
MIEHYLYACAQEGSISFSGVRIFNCYGPRLAGRVVDRFVNAAIRSQPLTIHGDGSQTRCFTYIDDLISAIYALLIQPSKVNKFFNIGSDVEVSINELAHLICDICSLDPEKFINYVSHKEAIGSSYEDIDRRVPDCSLARRELSWTYHIPLREGLAKMIEYERMVYQGFRSASALSSETDE